MKPLLFLSAIFFTKIASGQASALNVSPNGSYQNVSVSYLEMYDAGIKIPPSDYLDISGSPMFNKEWGTGWVLLKNGQQFFNVPLQYSIAANQLFFKKDSNTYLFAAGVNAFKLKYNDNGNLKEVFFKNGYPKQGNSADLFYQIIADGSTFQFLKLIKSDVNELYVYAAPSEKKYTLWEELYLYDEKNKMLTKVNTNAKSVLKAIPDYKDQIKTFITINNLKLKSENEIIVLINYLNKVNN